MELLQQQMARLCRQLEMHRILSSSNNSNSKHLMHGRSSKESSSGELLFLIQQARFVVVVVAFSLAECARPQIKAYFGFTGCNNQQNTYYGTSCNVRIHWKGKHCCCSAEVHLAPVRFAACQISVQISVRHFTPIFAFKKHFSSAAQQAVMVQLYVKTHYYYTFLFHVISAFIRKKTYLQIALVLVIKRCRIH